MAPGELVFWVFLFALLVLVAALGRSSGKEEARREMMLKEMMLKEQGDKTQQVQPSAQQTGSEQATHATTVQADQTAARSVSRSSEEVHKVPERAADNKRATVEDSAPAKTSTGGPSPKR